MMLGSGAVVVFVGGNLAGCSHNAFRPMRRGALVSKNGD